MIRGESEQCLLPVKRKFAKLVSSSPVGVEYQLTGGGFSMDDFLFATPSFIRDMGRVVDLGATMNCYNVSETPLEADMRALENDWSVVGAEISRAAESLSEPHVG
jgi:hypothetical protein